MSYRPTLFFKPTCEPCQWMSRLAVALSLGTIRRVAINSQEADALYRRYPGREGQLVLIEGQRVTFQRRVFAAVPRLILTTAPRLLMRRLVSAARALAR